MATLGDLQKVQEELIRKALSGSVFYAPLSASVPTALTTYTAPVGTAEVQSVAMTGTVTGGTFTLTYSGQTTAAINYNATAADVQAALEALSNINPGDVTCTGGPLPGTAVTVTFAVKLGNVAQMSATSSLTGTGPAVAVTTTTEGALTTPEVIDLATLPTGFADLGRISKEDAPTWARETELAEVTSWGALEATRSDISSDVSTLAVTAQETNIQTLQLYDNVDLSGVTPTAGSGEVSYSKPSRPKTKHGRLFAIMEDDSDFGPIYIAKLAPRAMVSEIGEQQWSDGDDPVAYRMTFTAKRDSTLGTAMKHYFGGPGWKALLTKMGFPYVV